MLLNMNFSKSVNTIIKDDSWIKSPADGIFRLPLEKEHAESGHTTSFVKFEPGSYFPPHEHPKGEEIVVIKGKFIDEHGEYKEGSWLRSTHFSEHFPYVDEETLILVKVGHLPII